MNKYSKYDLICGLIFILAGIGAITVFCWFVAIVFKIVGVSL